MRMLWLESFLECKKSFIFVFAKDIGRPGKVGDRVVVRELKMSGVRVSDDKGPIMDECQEFGALHAQDRMDMFCLVSPGRRR